MPLRPSVPSIRWLTLVFAFALLVAPAAALAQADFDGDGVFDDGDASGSPYDNPCPNGVVVGCDDNCRTVANPGQADVLPPVGVGDACQQPNATVSEQLSNEQFLDLPVYRWRQTDASFEPPAVAELTTLAIDGGAGGTCGFVEIGFFGPTVQFEEPFAPPYGGLACCPWEAKCSFFCVGEFSAPSNDCAVGVDCVDDASAAKRACSNILYGTEDYFNLTPEQRASLGVALQDGSGPCVGVPKVPYDACCFRRSSTVEYFWGSEAGNPAAGVDSDGDRHPDACDLCPATPDIVQVDADGDGRGAACDSDDGSRFTCADTDADGCDDCSSGHFDPSRDGVSNPPGGVCVPEPTFVASLGGGLALLAGFVRVRRRPAAPVDREGATGAEASGVSDSGWSSGRC
ncbi:MAG: hypothetical protein R3F35_24505 [Myxococcota bacterium]